MGAIAGAVMFRAGCGGMVEEKMCPVRRNHGLFVHSKSWERDTRTSGSLTTSVISEIIVCEFRLYSVVKLPEGIQMMLETWTMWNCALFSEMQCLSEPCLAV